MVEVEANPNLRHMIQALPLDPQALLDFKAPLELNARVSELLELNRKDALDERSRFELSQLIFAEELIQSLKAKAFGILHPECRE
jgi:hypothetical protein